MANYGLLLTMTEPPKAMEEEFNAWYDTEHLPERVSIPGFLSARRWVAEAWRGEGKYLATYELESAAVLDSPEYLARFQNPTPWTKRALGTTVVFKRWTCEQILPGRGVPYSATRALFLACGEVPKEHEQEFNRWYDEEHIPLLAAVPGVITRPALSRLLGGAALHRALRVGRRERAEASEVDRGDEYRVGEAH